MRKSKTRKLQIENYILPRCFTSPTRKVLKTGLRGAAVAGACEERSRTLAIIREHPGLGDLCKQALEKQITERGVLEVLGYEGESK